MQPYILIESEWLAEESAPRYDLEDRLVEFSALVIDLVEKMPSTRAGNHLAGQLVRSGTSTALNYGEVQGAESREDFIHKMRVGWKELKETRICLKIIRRKNMISEALLLQTALQEVEQLAAIFSKSISTAVANRKK